MIGNCLDIAGAGDQTQVPGRLLHVRPKIKKPMAWLCCCLASIALPLAAQDADVIFSGAQASFEDEFFAPATDAEAARFLTQATFGPVPADVASLKIIGYRAWIQQQLALAPTLTRPALEQYAATLTGTNALQQTDRLSRWFDQAVRSPDQLRQRMAFALSQVLVVSDRSDALAGEVVMLAEYQDILARRALGNFRDLLREATYSPTMGLYLSHLRNRKTDWTVSGGTLTAGTIAPDENYAREVMQLFTTGLFERNRDFSLKLIGGQPVPTYAQAEITETARVLTGLAYQCTGTDCQFNTSNFFSTPTTNANGTVDVRKLLPMACYPRYNDSGRNRSNGALLPSPGESKHIINGNVIGPSALVCDPLPSGATASDRQACIVYCNDGVTALLDSLFNNPNTPAFISRQLIQRFISANPSPEYIDRVAATFEDNGYGLRGDLSAVITAVLMDREARQAPSAGNFGKPKEPLLKLTAVWRAFSAQSSNNRSWGPTSPQDSYAQRPLGATSVFNFYEPDYQQPGAIADAGLYSPELQVLNETTAITTANDLWTRVWQGYSTSSGAFTTPTNAAYLSIADLAPIAGISSQLVDALNARMMYGAMSTEMRTVLINMLQFGMPDADANRRILATIHLISISPEYAVQQ